MNYTTQCSCGQINITLDLPQPIDQYTPRACDCDYCVAKNAAYLSDPQAILTLSPANSLKAQTQGSQQASFWLCNNCNDLIAVSCQYDDGMLGAVNAGVLAKDHNIQEGTAVSPKTLAPTEKLDRWRKVWGRVKLI